MVVEQNQYMSAAEEMYVRNADETIRAKCQAREDYYRRQRRIQKQLDEQKREIAEKDQTIAEQQQLINDQKQELEEKDQKYEDALSLIAELQSKLSNQ